LEQSARIDKFGGGIIILNIANGGIVALNIIIIILR
jgi:hypothetical protein